MGTIAFGVQHFFEWQLEAEAAAREAPLPYSSERSR
jgi:hypothetical protein